MKMTFLAWVIGWIVAVILICAFSAGVHTNDEED